MGSAFNDWANIVKRIPQGSILGLLLFNKFIFVVFFQQNVNSVILLMKIYSCGMNLDNIFTNLIQNA